MTDRNPEELHELKVPAGCISGYMDKFNIAGDTDVILMMYHYEAKDLYDQLRAHFEAGFGVMATDKDPGQLNLQDFPDLDEWAATVIKDELEDFFKSPGDQ